MSEIVKYLTHLFIQFLIHINKYHKFISISNMTTKTDKIVVCDFCKRNYCVQFGFRRDLAKYYDKLTKRNALSNREKMKEKYNKSEIENLTR